MKLAVPLVIFGVVEFPIDVRRYSVLGAVFLLLFLVISCLVKHRSRGGSCRTYQAAQQMGSGGSAIPPPCIADVFLDGQLGICGYRRCAFRVGGYSSLAR